MKNQKIHEDFFITGVFSFARIEDENGNKHILPLSYEGYSHFPFLPSETDKFIHYLEEYRNNFKDSEILEYNKWSIEHVYDPITIELIKNNKSNQ